jgi:hypothetical protein
VSSPKSKALSDHLPVGRAAELKNERKKGNRIMDSKKTKKNESKKTGKVSASMKAKMKEASKKAAAELKAKTNSAAAQDEKAPESAYTVEGPYSASGHFLFSIPSQHTGDDDYEHLVIAKNAEVACKLLADARITEKQPELTGDARAQLLVIATKNYLSRSPVKIESRNEPEGVLAINHHKLGISSPEVN